MSLLSGVLSGLEKVPAPQLVIGENVARMAVPAAVPKISGAAAGTGAHYTKKAVSHSCAPTEITENLPASNPPLAEHTDQPQHLVNTAATASPEWLAVRDRYVSHLMACHACFAPVGRYCAAGAVLRTAYNSTPTEIAQ